MFCVFEQGVDFHAFAGHHERDKMSDRLSRQTILAEKIQMFLTVRRDISNDVVGSLYEVDGAIKSLTGSASVLINGVHESLIL